MNRTVIFSSSLPETIQRSSFSSKNFEMVANDHFSLMRLSGMAVAQNSRATSVYRDESHHPAIASAPLRLRRHPEKREATQGVWMTLLLLGCTAFFIWMFKMTPAYLRPATAAQSDSIPVEKTLTSAKKKSNVDMINALLP